MNFQIKQCEIKIEYLFFAVIAFLLFTDTTGVALLGIAATVLHEAGHLVMMLLLEWFRENGSFSRIWCGY